MFSVYTSAFNIIKNNYDYITAFKNYDDFADEIIISTINDNDDPTIETLERIAESNNKFKIVKCDFKRADPLFWGKLRNEGLKNCTQEFCISLDLDELLPIWQKYNWINYARLLSYSTCDAYLVPLINLWGGKDYIRWDKDVNYLFKWALHKNLKNEKKLTRGAVNFAKKLDGTVDISKSDTNELIYEDGSLVRAESVIKDYQGSPYKYIQECASKIFIYHIGYLHFEDKLLRNKNFWNEQFNIQAGFNQKDLANKFAPTDEKDLGGKNLIKHNLKLWDIK